MKMRRRVNTVEIKKASQRGSVTLEAAIALPLFMCVIMLMAFLLRAIYVQEYVQHAISQAVADIAGSSYLYGASGALDIQIDNENAVGGVADKAEEVAMKTLELENWAPQGASEGISEVKGFLASFIKGKVNGAAFGIYLRHVTSGYMKGAQGETDDSLNQRLRYLNVSGGFGGIDFDGSEYLLDGSEDVVALVKYELKPPLSIKAFPAFEVTHKALARAWLYGSRGAKAEQRQEEGEEDIWSLGNFERGRKIQEIFHANLPINFPNLSSFENGEAALIRSLDTTAKSYQNADTLSKVINSYVNDVKSYEGQTQPWGERKISILPEEIMSRKLVLVIPSNEIDAKLSDVIDACMRSALDSGVILQVERYGKKRVEP